MKDIFQGFVPRIYVSLQPLCCLSAHQRKASISLEHCSHDFKKERQFTFLNIGKTVVLLGLGSFDHKTRPVWTYLTWAKDINCIFWQTRALDWKSDDIHPTTWIAWKHHVALHGVTMIETGTRRATNLSKVSVAAICREKRNVLTRFSVAIAFIFNWIYIFVTVCPPFFLTMWVSRRFYSLVKNKEVVSSRCEKLSSHV